MKEEFENQNEINAENLEVSEQIENEEEGTTKKRKKSKKIILAVFLGIIAALIFLFFATPYKLLFNAKKMTLLTYLSKDFTSATDLVKKIENNDVIKFFDNKETKSIDFDININNKKLTGNTAIDKDFIAIKLNEINSNYYLLENKKINELLEKFEMSDYEMSEEINLYDTLKLSNREIGKIQTFLLNCCYDILENTADENIIMQTNKSLKINGEQKEFKTVELKMSQTEFLNAQKVILERIKEDGILDIYIDKLNELAEIDKAEIEEDYDKQLEYISNYSEYMKSYQNLNDIQEENFIVYRMYFDDKNVIARELTQKYTYNDTVYEDVIMSFITTDEYYEIKNFTQIDQSAAYYTTISDVIIKEDNKKNHKINYIVDGFTVDNAEGTYEFAYTPIYSETEYNVLVEELADSTTVSINDKNNLYGIIFEYNKDNLKIQMNKTFEPIVKVNLEAKKDKTITKDTLIENGAIEISNKTKEELITEFNNVANKLSELL